MVMQSAIRIAPIPCAQTGIRDQPKRPASSAISTSQLVHSTNTVTMNTLSQVFCAAWKPAVRRSASSAGSLRASHKPIASPRPAISARNTQAAGQGTVPAATNKTAAIAAIHTAVWVISFETMSASAASGAAWPQRRRSLPGLALGAQPPLPPLPALLLRAFDAFASDGLEEDLEIFRSVVVGDLVARLDVPDRPQDHVAFDHVGFRVGATGVVGIAGDIAAARAVHGPAAVDLVHVAVAARLELGGLGMGDEAAAVGDDERALFDGNGGE